MADPADAGDFQAKLRRLEALVRQAERLADPAARGQARELVRALLDLHGAGLERLLDHVADAGAAGHAVIDACAADEVVGGLLLLHGLHPLDVGERVRLALEQAAAGVELVGVDDGVVRLRPAGRGRPAAGLRRAVEEAVFARAPEVVAVEIEGLEAAAADGRFALTVL